MVIPHSAFMALRLAQFISAAVVLGLAGYLLHLDYAHNVGSFSRLIYTAIIAATSLIASLIWLISRTLSPVSQAKVDLLCGGAYSKTGTKMSCAAGASGTGMRWV